jgi:hypothetical protein
MSGAPIVEPAICPDIFVTGATPLTSMGDNLRLTLLVAQRSTCDGRPENAVVAKLVGSRSDMLQIAAAIVRGCSSESEPLDKADETYAQSTQFLAGLKGRH